MYHIIKILNSILKGPASEKESIVKVFQNLVWYEDITPHTELESLLSELAYDLDFYEPDPKLRKEFEGYYGNEQLEKEVLSGIKRLRTEMDKIGLPIPKE